MSRCESWDGVGGKNTVSSLGTGGPMPAQAKRHYWSPRKRKSVESNGSWILGDGGRERRVVDDFKGGTRLATDAELRSKGGGGERNKGPRMLSPVGGGGQALWCKVLASDAGGDKTR